eukprot:COSAG01_NODE_1241_length_11085_cov_9.712361_22_plen_185_part_00
MRGVRGSLQHADGAAHHAAATGAAPARQPSRPPRPAAGAASRAPRPPREIASELRLTIIIIMRLTVITSERAPPSSAVQCRAVLCAVWGMWGLGGGGAALYSYPTACWSCPSGVGSHPSTTSAYAYGRLRLLAGVTAVRRLPLRLSCVRSGPTALRRMCGRCCWGCQEGRVVSRAFPSLVRGPW